MFLIFLKKQELLLGSAAKAEKILGWKRKTEFDVSLTYKVGRLMRQVV